MASLAPKALVLNSPDDWFDWLDYLKDLATAKHVWNLVDPSLESVPDLIEPTIPTLQDVVTEADETFTAANLQETDRATLTTLQRTYTMQFAQWQAKDSALQHINEVIKATTGMHYQAYIIGVATPYERLKALARRVTPTTAARVDAVRIAYRSALTNIRNTQWEVWLHAWEKAFKNGQRLEIPEVNGTFPTRDFLRAVATVTPSFTSVREVEVNRLLTKGEDLPDALDISAEWRNYMLVKGNFPAGHIGATLLGQRPPSSVPTCVCGQRHWYSECPYIFPDLRSGDSNWKPDPQVENHIQHIIATDQRVRDNINKAKQKHALAPPATPATVAPSAPPAVSTSKKPLKQLTSATQKVVRLIG